MLLLPAIACGWGAAWLRRERRPALLFTVAALILLQGWGMTLNAHTIFADRTSLFAPLDAPLPGGPGSVERDLSLDAMARVTALLGATLLAASLGRERLWRRRFIITIGLAAVSMVLLGCAERGSGAIDIFWSRARHLDYFFASFRNVTNAGEYLNVAAPLAMAAAWAARSPALRAAAVCALAMVVVGACVCGSKAAPILTAVLGATFVLAKRAEMEGGWIDLRRGPIVAAAVITAVTLMIWGAGAGVAQDRWGRFFSPTGEVTLVNRLRVDRLCLDAAGGAGWLGAGPGTFPVVFAGLQDESPDAPPGRWLAAHNDYLQAELEWGALGVGFWVVLFFGAMLVLARGLRMARWRTEDRTWALGLFLALAGMAVMALVDFPLQVASIQLQIAVVAGLGWSSFSWPRTRAREHLNFTCRRKTTS
jgi:hypothetical protein